MLRRRSPTISLLAVCVLAWSLLGNMAAGQPPSTPQSPFTNQAPHALVLTQNGPPPDASGPLPLPRVETYSSSDQSYLPLLADLIAQAQAVSPLVATASDRLQAAAGTALQASLLPNPSLGYAAQEVGNDDAAGQHGIFIQQTKVRGNKIQIRHSVAQQEYLARTVDLQSEMARVEISVRRAFFQSMVARRRVETIRALVAMAEQTTAAIGRLVEAEEMARTAKLQAQLAVTNLRTRLITAEQRYAAVRRELAALLNVPAAALPDLGMTGFDQLPDYRWPELSQLAMHSLKTDRQRFVIDRASSQLALERAKQVVDVDWQVSVYYDDASNDVFTGLQVSRPLLFQDWNQGNIQRANAEFAAQQSQVGTIVQQTRMGLADAFREYVAQRDSARLIASDLLPRSRESLELTRMALSEGEIGYLEVLVSQQTFAQASQQYFDALDAAWQGVARLESQFVD